MVFAGYLPRQYQLSASQMNQYAAVPRIPKSSGGRLTFSPISLVGIWALRALCSGAAKGDLHHSAASGTA